eukprot:850924-Rhodomonas_salina.2
MGGGWGLQERSGIGCGLSYAPRGTASPVSYARPTRCPVLSYALSYALSGTELGGVARRKRARTPTSSAMSVRLFALCRAS